MGCQERAFHHLYGVIKMEVVFITNNLKHHDGEKEFEKGNGRRAHGQCVNEIC